MNVRAVSGSVIIVGASFLVACASNGSHTAARERTSCGLVGRDSVFALAGPVYHDCAVDRKARLVSTGVHPDFRPTARGCYSAEVEFVVDAAGRPEVGTARL